MSTAAPRPLSPGPRILVCGWAGAGNVGDELLTRAMVERLHGAGASVVVASRDPRATAALHPGVEAVPWGPRGLRHLDRIDGVCLGPGGILQDSSSLWNLPGHLVLPWWARQRGAALAVVGVGAEPLRRRSSARLLRRVLGDAPIVTRDDASTAALAAAGLRARTGVDVVFGLDSDPAPTLPGERRDEIVVAVGPSTRPGRIAPASRRLVAPPVEEISRALDRLAEHLGCRIVLTRFRGDRDHETAEAIARCLAADHVILGPDIDEHVRCVGGARLVVTSRYHPVVVAAVAGTPTVVVSNQPKIVSLVAQIDDPDRVHLDTWAGLAGLSPAEPVDAPRAVAHLSEALALVHRAISDLVTAATEARGDTRRG